MVFEKVTGVGVHSLDKEKDNMYSLKGIERETRNMKQKTKTKKRKTTRKI